MLSFRLIHIFRGGCVCSSNTSSSTDGLAETRLHTFTFQQANASFLRRNIYTNQRECLICKLLRCEIESYCARGHQDLVSHNSTTFVACFLSSLSLSVSFLNASSGVYGSPEAKRIEIMSLALVITRASSVHIMIKLFLCSILKCNTSLKY